MVSCERCGYNGNGWSNHPDAMSVAWNCFFCGAEPPPLPFRKCDRAGRGILYAEDTSTRSFIRYLYFEASDIPDLLSRVQDRLSADQIHYTVPLESGIWSRVWLNGGPRPCEAITSRDPYPQYR